MLSRNLIVLAITEQFASQLSMAAIAKAKSLAEDFGWIR